MNTITLTYSILFAPPITLLEIRIEPDGDAARGKVTAHGIPWRERTSFDEEPKIEVLAEEQCKISKTKFRNAWKKIVAAGGLDLGDYQGIGRGTDLPTGTVEFKWKGENNTFEGYDLEAEEPYKTIVRAIEGMVKVALERVEMRVGKVVDE